MPRDLSGGLETAVWGVVGSLVIGLGLLGWLVLNSAVALVCLGLESMITLEYSGFGPGSHLFPVPGF